VDSNFLAKFETRDMFNELLNLRARLKEVYEDEILNMIKNREYQKTCITFIVPSVDSDEAGLLELLENDLEDFFYGCQVLIESQEENDKRKSIPMKTIKHAFTLKTTSEEGDTDKPYTFKIRVYKNLLVKC
jgi:hypothetical protein